MWWHSNVAIKASPVHTSKKSVQRDMALLSLINIQIYHKGLAYADRPDKSLPTSLTSSTKGVIMELQQFLEFHLQRMLQCFCLTHFDVEIKEEETPSYMEINVDTTYLEAEIVYGNLIKDKYEQGDWGFVLKTLTHEVSHLFTSQITSLFKETKHSEKVEEQVTEHISRLLYKYYKKQGGQS